MCTISKDVIRQFYGALEKYSPGLFHPKDWHGKATSQIFTVWRDYSEVTDFERFKLLCGDIELIKFLHLCHKIKRAHPLEVRLEIKSILTPTKNTWSKIKFFFRGR